MPVAFLLYAVSLIIIGSLAVVLAMFRAPQLDTSRPLALLHATRTGRFETRSSKVELFRANN
jgi:hypothetical protein